MLPEENNEIKSEDIKDNEQPTQETAEETAEENAADNAQEVQEELSEEDKLRNELAAVNELNAQLQDKYLRQVADFDNFRKNQMKRMEELMKNGGEKTITKILPVLDDFERALQTMEKSDDIASIKEGVSLIFQKFLNTLKSEGLQKIETEGKDFDVDFHEAIAMVPAPSDDLKGKVIDCVQTGYTLNDKVIRHSKVAVGQ